MDVYETLASDPQLVIADRGDGTAVYRRVRTDARCRYCRARYVPGADGSGSWVWTASGTRVRGECRPCQNDSWY